MGQSARIHRKLLELLSQALSPTLISQETLKIGQHAIEAVLSQRRTLYRAGEVDESEADWSVHFSKRPKQRARTMVHL